MISIPLAALAASRPDRAGDLFARGFTLLGQGMPQFWVGIMLILLLAVNVRAFPVGGYGDGAGAHLYYLFLPALTLAIAMSPTIIRSLRASMIEVLGSEYVGTARSKGAAGMPLFRDHVLRNAAIPTVSIIGVNLGYLVGGSLVIEKVFALPGLGSLMVNAIFSRDFPTIQARHAVRRRLRRRGRDPDRRRLHDARPAGRPGRRHHPHDHPHRRARGLQAAPPRVALPVAPRLVPQRLPDGRASSSSACWCSSRPRPGARAVRPDRPGPRARAASRPSAAHWLGTDKYGRDVLSRLIWGARVDLRVGFLAVLIPFVVGGVLGALAGYFGGSFDTVLMRIVDVFFAFPFYVLVIVLVFVLGAGETSIYLAIAAVSWVSYAKIVRGEVLVAKQQDYVVAARLGGMSHARMLVRHIAPNVMTQAVIYAMSDIVMDIMAIVTLGYLGLGIAPPTAEWGSMILDGQEFITTQWQQATIPGLAVVVTSLGLSFLGDGLCDLLSPERRR